MSAPPQNYRIVNAIFLALTAPFLIVLSPFIKFVSFRDYGFTNPEVALVIIWHLLAIIPLTLLSLWRPKTAYSDCQGAAASTKDFDHG